MHTILDIATVSDEAFALFLLENAWETWVAIAGNAEGVPVTRYSVSGPAGTKKFPGWTGKGIS